MTTDSRQKATTGDVWPDDVGMSVPGCQMETGGNVSVTWLWRHSKHLLAVDEQQLDHLYHSTMTYQWIRSVSIAFV